MASIDQHSKLHRPRSTEGGKPVERRTNSPARKQHVIHQDHDPVVNSHLGNLGRRGGAMPRTRKVVSIQRDVECSRSNHLARNVGDHLRQALTKQGATSGNPQENQRTHFRGGLDNLVPDTAKGPLNIWRGEYLSRTHLALLPRLTGRHLKQVVVQV